MARCRATTATPGTAAHALRETSRNTTAVLDLLTTAAATSTSKATEVPRARFLARFPAQDSKTDYQTSILQALYLMNSDLVALQTSLPRNRTLATLAEQRTSTARKLESLYLVVLSRKPRPEESERFVQYVDAGDPKKTLADVFWVLLNSPEFLLNH